MKNIAILLMAFTAFMLSSCGKDDIDTFDKERASVRFAAMVVNVSHETDGVSEASYDSNDSLLNNDISFLNHQEVDEYVYDIPLTLIGKTADHDRIVAYEVLPEGDAKDYEITEAVVPANSYKGHIRIVLKKNDELSEKTYVLYLRLKAGDELALGPKEYLKARVSWNNQIPVPPHNNLRRTYNMLVKSSLGFTSTSMAYYSPNAMRAIMAALNWNDWDNAAIHGNKANTAAAYANYKYLPQYRWIYNDNSYKGYAATFNDYLRQYERQHGKPLLHDAGTGKGQPVEARSY